MTLTEFLLARIAEDERTLHCEWNCHERVYREGEAKRKIVALYEEHGHSAEADHRWSGFDGGYATATDHTLGILAAVYADHPDYQQEWKP